MAHKAEIGWTRTDDDGGKLDVFARHVGDEWLFFRRHRRYEQWQALKEPPLADWLELLEAIERRVVRRRLPPAAAQQVKQAIRERFPEAKLE